MENEQKGKLYRGRFWRELIFLLALLAVATGLLRLGYKHLLRTAYPLHYTDLVTSAAEEYGFDSSLIYGLIHTESGFDPQAVSRMKALGLMQITPDTFEWVQFRFPEEESHPTNELFRPEINILYGVRNLFLLREEFPDTRTMLAAYNAGMGNVRRWLQDPQYSDDGVTLKDIPYEETRNYVKKVPAAQDLYKKLYHLDKRKDG